MSGIEDVFYPFLKIYNSLPKHIKFLMGAVYRRLPLILRYGRYYGKYQQRIKKFENSDKGEIFRLRDNLLRKQLFYTLNNIPYYKQYRGIRTLSEFQKLPIIDKNIINENPSHFINSNFKKKALKSNTGGSSGTPFSFFIEKGVTRSKEAAHFNWYWGQYGFQPGDKTLVIRGKPLKDNANYEFQAIGNKLAISCYSLNQKSIRLIYRAIKEFEPKFIHAYPSSLSVFTKELQTYLKGAEAGFKIAKIFLGSEFLLAEDQIYFENFYKSQVVTWYGHSECLLHGTKCEISGDYHFFPFYGYFELVDKNNFRIEKAGVEGRIIASGFDNKVMPFMRYDTGDLGMLSNNKMCKCGFKGQSLSRISGRVKEYIVLKDFTRVTLTAFIFGQHHEEFEKIKEIQIIQNQVGHIALKIVPLSGFTSQKQEKLKQRLIDSVKGDLLSIEIEIVEKIEKTERGKHKLLIQNLNR